jgi:DNA polymerase-1
MNDTLLLIDANSLIHRAFHALPPLTSPDGKPAGALYGVSSILLKIFKEGPTGQGPAGYIAAAFDRQEPTFREKEYKEYKITRAPTATELVSQLIECRELFKTFGIKTFEFPGFEADDIVFALAQKFSAKGLKVFILSGDRDLLQAVDDNKIQVIMPQRGISDILIYDEISVMGKFGVSPKQFADYKGLVGDTSDNIPGVPGIGPKTATNLIGEYKSLEGLYEEVDGVGLVNVKMQEKLKTYREQAFLSKRLATLNKDVPLNVSLDDLRFKLPSYESLSVYFDKFGFKTLLERFQRYSSDQHPEE